MEKKKYLTLPALNTNSFAYIEEEVKTKIQDTIG